MPVLYKNSEKWLRVTVDSPDYFFLFDNIIIAIEFNIQAMAVMVIQISNNVMGLFFYPGLLSIFF